MDTLKFIANRWNLDLSGSLPIKIKISRFLSFISLLKDLGVEEGAEIGVCTGRYSQKLLEGIPDLRLHCIDPWEPYSEYVESKVEKLGFNKLYNNTLGRLKGRNCVIYKKYSMDAVKEFKDNSLDFVFIDGNHSFRYAVDDIAEWSKKVRPGGIVSGHDYWMSVDVKKPWKREMTAEDKIMLCQVKEAVDAWTRAHHIKPWFIITGDKCPTWFWVKE